MRGRRTAEDGQMELSDRLQAVASLVTAGHRVADIGTDHAYIPIYLLWKGMAPSAIAMDVNEGPLKKAEAHVKENGMEEKIRLRLSDGFEKLEPFEVDTAVIAGMGGPLMIRILSAYPEVTRSLKELVLQPQSEIAKVRAFLLEEGFLFIQEDMVKDDGKYYPMMKAAPPRDGRRGGQSKGAEKSLEPDRLKTRKERERGGWMESGSPEQDTLCVWDEAEIRYGKLLLEMRPPVPGEYLDREQATRQNILAGLRGQTGERIRIRRMELEEELDYIWKGLEYYAV